MVVLGLFEQSGSFIRVEGLADQAGDVFADYVELEVYFAAGV